MIPGEYFFDGPDLELNAGRPVVTLSVNNTGDRPVQIGAHYHFFEVNKALVFDRVKAYGMRLDLPSGTSVAVRARRRQGGQADPLRRVVGWSTGSTAWSCGRLDDPYTRETSLKRCIEQGYGHKPSK